VIEAQSPIDTALDIAESNLAVDDVLDFVSGVTHVKNVGFTNLAEVVGLTAGRWV